MGTDDGGLPPSYLSIEGHKKCLSSHVAAPEDTHQSVCLPMVQPQDCPPEAYIKLSEVVKNGKIQPCNGPLIGPGGIPPSYLSIEGHKKCLSSHVTAPEDTHETVCLPWEQPQDCPTEAWEKLADVGQNGIIEPCHEQTPDGNYNKIIF